MCVENAVFSLGAQGAERSSQAGATRPVPGEQDSVPGSGGTATQTFGL